MVIKTSIKSVRLHLFQKCSNTVPEGGSVNIRGPEKFVP